MNMNKLKSDLTFLHGGIRIPLYLYDSKGFVQAWPEEISHYLPPASYLAKAIQNDFASPYIPTAFSSQFGLLPLPDSCYLVVGPVGPLSYTRGDFHVMFREYHVRESEQEYFQLLFQSIPKCIPQEFGDILAMISHFLTPDAVINLTPPADNPFSEQLLAQSVEGLYQQQVIDRPNTSLEVEAMITEIVEKGQFEHIEGIAEQIFHANPGTLAQTPLRNEKNLFVAMITLITRAAIRGGLEDQLALQLSDQYIQKAELCSNSKELDQLRYDALYCFTSQVAGRQKSHTVGGDMSPIIDYVRKHLNTPLTVAGLAEIFGYHPSYLSTRFRKELGFGLSAFIYRTRLEAARDLLAYTSKSIPEISEHFCFSDQSHFQRKFKAQYGVTPLQYRNRVWSDRKHPRNQINADSSDHL